MSHGMLARGLKGFHNKAVQLCVFGKTYPSKRLLFVEVGVAFETQVSSMRVGPMRTRASISTNRRLLEKDLCCLGNDWM